MLSSLPKLFDKNFVIGFFLPALLAVLAAAWTFPQVSLLEPLRTLAASDKKLSELLYVALMVWVLAIVLLTTNNFQYRLLEGYSVPVALRAWVSGWQRFRFRRLTAKVARLQGQTGRQSELISATLALLNGFPTSIDQLLPTRFGNAIRAFEVYPRRVYGADSIPVWLRLGSVIPKSFAAQIEDARSRVDCLMNVACLAAALSVVALGGSLLQANWKFQLTDPFFFAPGGAREFNVALAGFVVAYLAYRWATVQVQLWGELVKSAFDCYLVALIRQMGYEVPLTAARRRAFWDDFNRVFLYQQTPLTDWPLAPEPPPAGAAGAADATAADDADETG
jgi:hypothetical protein